MATSDCKLKESFRRLFPSEAKRLDACKTQEEINRVHEEMITDSKRKLREALNKTCDKNLSGRFLALTEPSDQTVPIPLKKEMYEKLITANGEEIKNLLHVLIDGLQRLKGMEKDDPGLVTAQIILSGALGVGKLSTYTVVQRLWAGFVENAAALAGVETATVEVVCSIVAVVIVAVIIPIIYFMEKPANCICLLINELDSPLTFSGDHCIHGKNTLVTTPIPAAVDLGDGNIYPVSGLIASQKSDSALIGSQYGFVMKYNEEYVAFGMECPLTNLYGGNNCYCEFTSNAEAVANSTNVNNKLCWEASKGNLRLSIKCNSASGSIAYYVARAYKAGN